MTSRHYEVQLLKDAGLAAERVISRTSVFAPDETIGALALERLGREAAADGVRVLDAWDRPVFQTPGERSDAVTGLRAAPARP